MVGTNDIRTLLKNRLSNLTLAVPIPAILFPAFLGDPIGAPLELFIPHIIYLALFALSILNTMKFSLQSNRNHSQRRAPAT